MACATPPEDPSSPPSSAPAADARSEGGGAQGEDTSQLSAQLSTTSFRLWRRDEALEAGLYIVSTPIGNLRDVTLRALDTLASVDLICAEDTRVAMKLLNAYGVSSTVRPYHDHNGAQARPGLLKELEGGARIALISDAGTPLVSDPGYKLVREAAERGINVIAIPGASAALAGLAISGLPSDRFLFAGFPPQKGGARKTWLAGLADIEATLIVYEGPSRLAQSLADMAEVLGNRDAVVGRELTKRFEEARRGRLSDLAAAYGAEGPPKGELVIVIGPPVASDQPAEASLDAAISAADPALPMKAAAGLIADRLGLKRRDVYARMLALRASAEDESEDD